MIAIGLWYVWYLNAEKVSTIETLQSFDPFAILELENDATPRDIKKQYRKMSLEKHPDKNPDDPLAVQEFIKLTKAYNVSIASTITRGNLESLFLSLSSKRSKPLYKQKSRSDLTLSLHSIELFFEGFCFFISVLCYGLITSLTMPSEEGIQMRI